MLRDILVQFSLQARLTAISDNNKSSREKKCRKSKDLGLMSSFFQQEKAPKASVSAFPLAS